MINTEGPESAVLSDVLGVFREVTCRATAVEALGEHVLGYPCEPARNDYMAAFRQANWEILVEYPLNCRLGPVVLDVLDGRADYWPQACRVIDEEAEPTHQVRFRIQPGSREHISEQVLHSGDHRFHGFVSLRDGWHWITGEADYVLCEDDQGNPLVFHVDDVLLRIAPLQASGSSAV